MERAQFRVRPCHPVRGEPGALEAPPCRFQIGGGGSRRPARVLDLDARGIDRESIEPGIGGQAKRHQRNDDALFREHSPEERDGPAHAPPVRPGRPSRRAAPGVGLSAAGRVRDQPALAGRSRLTVTDEVTAARLNQWLQTGPSHPTQFR